MNASAEPWKLYVALQYITKVHGLTPHSSTDRCPFELIKNAPLPSLFPKLTSDVSRKLELTVTRDSAAKLRGRKIFSEGDNVIVYDNHQKLSYPAVVSEILGTNNYLVISDNGTKHVSGDVMSRAAQVGAAVESVDYIDNDIFVEDEVLDDDTGYVMSDMSYDMDMPPTNMNVANNNFNNFNNVVNHRRGQQELMNLGQVPQLPCLRSGRI